MKNIFLNIKPYILSGALTLLLGCDKKLDIQPQDSIDASTALTSPANVQNTLLGAYERLQGGDLFGTNYNLISELLGDGGEVEWSGTFTGYTDIWQKAITADNTEAEGTWIRGYDAINIVNNVISAINIIEDEDLKNQVLGEAHFIRGIVYFELVRFYALSWEAGSPNTQLGVPLVLEPTKSITSSSNVSRATVADVYAKIIEDLTQAKTLLPETAENARATTYAASAFLARVYLQQGVYQGALTEANRVIESGEFELNDSYESAFNNTTNTAEDIFAIQQSAQSVAGNNGDNNTFYASFPGIGRADMDILETHLELYEPNDERLSLFYEGSGRKPDILRTGKWSDQFSIIQIVRLAEMYLIRAEANFRLGTSTGATPLEDINTIRSRAGLEDLATTLTIDDILLERRLELAWEGHKLHDIKRLKQNVGTLPYNSPKLVLPIPQRETDANTSLEQNPGYQ